MKVYKNILLSWLFVIFVIINFTACSVEQKRDNRANDVFTQNLQSVVELKAFSDSIGESFGTAEFIDKDGRLVTNAHVISYSRLGETHTFDHYSIRFAFEEDYREVDLVKYDTELDVAVLKLKEECNFKPIKINAKSLTYGQTVYAVGNAMNYGLSITTGCVSSPLVRIEYSSITREVIQSDLTIAEGNSGGALLNENGEMIGITSFRTKDHLGAVVYGFAYSIPIDLVMKYLDS